ncbi:isochorismatase hydrolase [Denitrovibrio acetiphilus DSM 12809]|uniref:Isochorismatase hydrolase n=1 Tax=Denitrovibrio acetiphilus (strain DSM 12809 / NBRC 114555 / N2460) TaxID=522772 RepID=D4H310_DENA2|nr:hydrolase [Denitrovibrio acetiphilus]ADD69033.1 isochorismatase hydrolase [Denitrovibrio acetiphilus DSM 12809]
MFKLKTDDTAVVVIDVQEKLVVAMDPDIYADMLSNTSKLVKGAKVLGLPVLCTQQYTKGLGGTVAELARDVSSHIEKVTFSCCGEESFKAALKENGIKNVVISGMETHVCVLQTVLDLLDDGYNVHVAADAVCSRSDFNWEIALDMMSKAGAVITCAEAVLFMLLGTAGTPEFKEISKIVK